MLLMSLELINDVLVSCAIDVSRSNVSRTNIF
jgi:hypothetical protein